MSIRFLKLSLASPESIRSWTERVLPNGKRVGKILKGDLIDYKNGLPIRDGLSCERIFGPMVSFTCTCGRFKCIETRGIHIVHDTLRSSRLILPDVSRQTGAFTEKQWDELEFPFQTSSNSVRLQKGIEVNPIVSQNTISNQVQKLVSKEKPNKKLKLTEPLESSILQPIAYRQKKMIRFLSDFYYDYASIYHSNKNEMVPSFIYIVEEPYNLTLATQNSFKSQKIWYPSKKKQFFKPLNFFSPTKTLTDHSHLKMQLREITLKLETHSFRIQNLLKPLYKFILQIYTGFWFDLKFYYNNFLYEKHIFLWIPYRKFKTSKIYHNFGVHPPFLLPPQATEFENIQNTGVSKISNKMKIRGLYDKSQKLPIISGILSLETDFLNLNFSSLPRFLVISSCFARIIQNNALSLQKTNPFFFRLGPSFHSKRSDGMEPKATKINKVHDNWYNNLVLQYLAYLEFFFKGPKYSYLELLALQEVVKSHACLYPSSKQAWTNGFRNKPIRSPKNFFSSQIIKYSNNKIWKFFPFKGQSEIKNTLFSFSCLRMLTIKKSKSLSKMYIYWLQQNQNIELPYVFQFSIKLKFKKTKIKPCLSKYLQISALYFARDLRSTPILNNFNYGCVPFLCRQKRNTYSKTFKQVKISQKVMFFRFGFYPKYKYNGVKRQAEPEKNIINNINQRLGLEIGLFKKKNVFTENIPNEISSLIQEPIMFNHIKDTKVTNISFGSLKTSSFDLKHGLSNPFQKISSAFLKKNRNSQSKIWEFFQSSAFSKDLPISLKANNRKNTDSLSVLVDKTDKSDQKLLKSVSIFDSFKKQENIKTVSSSSNYKVNSTIAYPFSNSDQGKLVSSLDSSWYKLPQGQQDKIDIVPSRLTSSTKSEDISKPYISSNIKQNIRVYKFKNFPPEEIRYCPYCEVELLPNSIRRYRLGYIEFISPVTHIWYTANSIPLLLNLSKTMIEGIASCHEALSSGFPPVYKWSYNGESPTSWTFQMQPLKLPVNLIPKIAPINEILSYSARKKSNSAEIIFGSKSITYPNYKQDGSIVCIPSFRIIPFKLTWKNNFIIYEKRIKSPFIKNVKTNHKEKIRKQENGQLLYNNLALFNPQIDLASKHLDLNNNIFFFSVPQALNSIAEFGFTNRDQFSITNQFFFASLNKHFLVMNIKKKRGRIFYNRKHGSFRSEINQTREKKPLISLGPPLTTRVLENRKHGRVPFFREPLQTSVFSILENTAALPFYEYKKEMLVEGRSKQRSKGNPSSTENPNPLKINKDIRPCRGLFSASFVYIYKQKTRPYGLKGGGTFENTDAEALSWILSKRQTLPLLLKKYKQESTQHLFFPLIENKAWPFYSGSAYRFTPLYLYLGWNPKKKDWLSIKTFSPVFKISNETMREFSFFNEIPKKVDSHYDLDTATEYEKKREWLKLEGFFEDPSNHKLPDNSQINSEVNHKTQEKNKNDSESFDNLSLPLVLPFLGKNPDNIEFQSNYSNYENFHTDPLKFIIDLFSTKYIWDSTNLNGSVRTDLNHDKHSHKLETNRDTNLERFMDKQQYNDIQNHIFALAYNDYITSLNNIYNIPGILYTNKTGQKKSKFIQKCFSLKQFKWDFSFSLFSSDKNNNQNNFWPSLDLFYRINDNLFSKTYPFLPINLSNSMFKQISKSFLNEFKNIEIEDFKNSKNNSLSLQEWYPNQVNSQLKFNDLNFTNDCKNYQDCFRKLGRKAYYFKLEQITRLENAFLKNLFFRNKFQKTNFLKNRLLVLPFISTSIFNSINDDNKIMLKSNYLKINQNFTIGKKARFLFGFHFFPLFQQTPFLKLPFKQPCFKGVINIYGLNVFKPYLLKIKYPTKLFFSSIIKDKFFSFGFSTSIKIAKFLVFSKKNPKNSLWPLKSNTVNPLKNISFLSIQKRNAVVFENIQNTGASKVLLNYKNNYQKLDLTNSYETEFGLSFSFEDSKGKINQNRENVENSHSPWLYKNHFKNLGNNWFSVFERLKISQNLVDFKSRYSFFMLVLLKNKHFNKDEFFIDQQWLQENTNKQELKFFLGNSNFQWKSKKPKLIPVGIPVSIIYDFIISRSSNLIKSISSLETKQIKNKNHWLKTLEILYRKKRLKECIQNQYCSNFSLTKSLNLEDSWLKNTAALPFCGYKKGIIVAGEGTKNNCLALEQNNILYVSAVKSILKYKYFFNSKLSLNQVISHESNRKFTLSSKSIGAKQKLEPLTLISIDTTKIEFFGSLKIYAKRKFLEVWHYTDQNFKNKIPLLFNRLRDLKSQTENALNKKHIYTNLINGTFPIIKINQTGEKKSPQGQIFYPSKMNKNLNCLLLTNCHRPKANNKNFSKNHQFLAYPKGHTFISLKIKDKRLAFVFMKSFQKNFLTSAFDRLLNSFKKWSYNTRFLLVKPKQFKISFWSPPLQKAFFFCENQKGTSSCFIKNKTQVLRSATIWLSLNQNKQKIMVLPWKKLKLPTKKITLTRKKKQISHRIIKSLSLNNSYCFNLSRLAKLIRQPQIVGNLKHLIMKRHKSMICYAYAIETIQNQKQVPSYSIIPSKSIKNFKSESKYFNHIQSLSLKISCFSYFDYGPIISLNLGNNPITQKKLTYQQKVIVQRIPKQIPLLGFFEQASFVWKNTNVQRSIEKTAVFFIKNSERINYIQSNYDLNVRVVNPQIFQVDPSIKIFKWGERGHIFGFHPKYNYNGVKRQAEPDQIDNYDNYQISHQFQNPKQNHTKNNENDDLGFLFRTDDNSLTTNWKSEKLNKKILSNSRPLVNKKQKDSAWKGNTNYYGCISQLTSWGSDHGAWILFLKYIRANIYKGDQLLPSYFNKMNFQMMPRTGSIMLQQLLSQLVLIPKVLDQSLNPNFISGSAYRSTPSEAMGWNPKQKSISEIDIRQNFATNRTKNNYTTTHKSINKTNQNLMMTAKTNYYFHYNSSFFSTEKSRIAHINKSLQATSNQFLKAPPPQQASCFFETKQKTQLLEVGETKNNKLSSIYYKTFSILDGFVFLKKNLQKTIQIEFDHILMKKSAHLAKFDYKQLKWVYTKSRKFFRDLKTKIISFKNYPNDVSIFKNNVFKYKCLEAEFGLRTGYQLSIDNQFLNQTRDTCVSSLRHKRSAKVTKDTYNYIMDPQPKPYFICPCQFLINFKIRPNKYALYAYKIKKPLAHKRFRQIYQSHLPKPINNWYRLNNFFSYSQDTINQVIYKTHYFSPDLSIPCYIPSVYNDIRILKLIYSLIVSFQLQFLSVNRQTKQYNNKFRDNKKLFNASLYSTVSTASNKAINEYTTHKIYNIYYHIYSGSACRFTPSEAMGWNPNQNNDLKHKLWYPQPKSKSFFLDLSINQNFMISHRTSFNHYHNSLLQNSVKSKDTSHLFDDKPWLLKNSSFVLANTERKKNTTNGVFKSYSNENYVENFYFSNQKIKIYNVLISPLEIPKSRFFNFDFLTTPFDFLELKSNLYAFQSPKNSQKDPKSSLLKTQAPSVVSHLPVRWGDTKKWSYLRPVNNFISNIKFYHHAISNFYCNENMNLTKNLSNSPKNKFTNNTYQNSVEAEFKSVLPINLESYKGQIQSETLFIKLKEIGNYNLLMKKKDTLFKTLILKMNSSLNPLFLVTVGANRDQIRLTKTISNSIEKPKKWNQDSIVGNEYIDNIKTKIFSLSLVVPPLNINNSPFQQTAFYLGKQRIRPSFIRNKTTRVLKEGALKREPFKKLKLESTTVLEFFRTWLFLDSVHCSYLNWCNNLQNQHQVNLTLNTPKLAFYNAPKIKELHYNNSFLKFLQFYEYRKNFLLKKIFKQRIRLTQDIVKQPFAINKKLITKLKPIQEKIYQAPPAVSLQAKRWGATQNKIFKTMPNITKSSGFFNYLKGSPFNKHFFFVSTKGQHGCLKGSKNFAKQRTKSCFIIDKTPLIEGGLKKYLKQGCFKRRINNKFAYWRENLIFSQAPPVVSLQAKRWCGTQNLLSKKCLILRFSQENKFFWFRAYTLLKRRINIFYYQRRNLNIKYEFKPFGPQIKHNSIYSDWKNLKSFKSQFSHLSNTTVKYFKNQTRFRLLTVPHIFDLQDQNNMLSIMQKNKIPINIFSPLVFSSSIKPSRKRIAFPILKAEFGFRNGDQFSIDNQFLNQTREPKQLISNPSKMDKDLNCLGSASEKQLFWGTRTIFDQNFLLPLQQAPSFYLDKQRTRPCFIRNKTRIFKGKVIKKFSVNNLGLKNSPIFDFRRLELNKNTIPEMFNNSYITVFDEKFEHAPIYRETFFNSDRPLSSETLFREENLKVSSSYKALLQKAKILEDYPVPDTDSTDLKSIYLRLLNGGLPRPIGWNFHSIVFGNQLPFFRTSFVSHNKPKMRSYFSGSAYRFTPSEAMGWNPKNKNMGAHQINWGKSKNSTTQSSNKSLSQFIWDGNQNRFKNWMHSQNQFDNPSNINKKTSKDVFSMRDQSKLENETMTNINDGTSLSFSGFRPSAPLGVKRQAEPDKKIQNDNKNIISKSETKSNSFSKNKEISLKSPNIVIGPSLIPHPQQASFFYESKHRTKPSFIDYKTRMFERGDKNEDSLKKNLLRKKNTFTNLVGNSKSSKRNGTFNYGRNLRKLRLQYLRNFRRLRFIEYLKATYIKPEWMILSLLPVLPPDLRPVIANPRGYITGDINTHYQNVIYRNNNIEKLLDTFWIPRKFYSKIAFSNHQKATILMLSSIKSYFHSVDYLPIYQAPPAVSLQAERWGGTQKKLIRFKNRYPISKFFSKLTSFPLTFLYENKIPKIKAYIKNNERLSLFPEICSSIKVLPISNLIERAYEENKFINKSVKVWQSHILKPTNNLFYKTQSVNDCFEIPYSKSKIQNNNAEKKRLISVSPGRKTRTCSLDGGVTFENTDIITVHNEPWQKSFIKNKHNNFLSKTINSFAPKKREFLKFDTKSHWFHKVAKWSITENFQKYKKPACFDLYESMPYNIDSKPLLKLYNHKSFFGSNIGIATGYNKIVQALRFQFLQNDSTFAKNLEIFIKDNAVPRLEKKIIRIQALHDSKPLQEMQYSLQKAVDALIDNSQKLQSNVLLRKGRPLKSLSDNLKGKEGRFRQHLLGKRVDYSGRSVIVVGPDLKLYECGIPLIMALRLFQPFLILYLIYRFKIASLLATQLIQRKHPMVINLLKKFIETWPILLNRAPTLHRMNIQAFKIRLVQGKAILLHPLVCSSYNADFDGDQMGVHVPITQQARAESWKLLWSINNSIGIASRQPLFLPSQDMVIGNYYLTAPPIDNSLASLMPKKQLSFNLNIKDEIPFYNFSNLNQKFVYKNPILSRKLTRYPSFGIQRPSGFEKMNHYFFSLEEAYQYYLNTAYRFHINTPVWFRFYMVFETSEREKPIEITIDKHGNTIYTTKYYEKQLKRNRILGKNTFYFSTYLDSRTSIPFLSIQKNNAVVFENTQNTSASKSFKTNKAEFGLRTGDQFSIDHQFLNQTRDACVSSLRQKRSAIILSSQIIFNKNLRPILLNQIIRSTFGRIEFYYEAFCVSRSTFTNNG